MKRHSWYSRPPGFNYFHIGPITESASHHNDIMVEVRNRIQQAWGCFWSLRQWLLNRRIPIRQRLDLWRLAIDSTLLWGSASWTVNDSVKRIIVAMEHAMHRKILMMPRSPVETCWQYRGRCARIYASWLRERKAFTIYQKCLNKIWTWAGHVARLPDTRIVKCCLEHKCVQWQYVARLVGGQGHRRGGAFKRWENKLEQWCMRQWNQPWMTVHATHSKETWNNLASDFARATG